MLCCLVQKDCKDINISMRPCEHPAGHMQVTAREAKKKVIEEERAVANRGGTGEFRKKDQNLCFVSSVVDMVCYINIGHKKNHGNPSVMGVNKNCLTNKMSYLTSDLELYCNFQTKCM